MAGDTPIRKQAGLPRNLFMAPPIYGTQPAQPALPPQGQMGGMPPQMGMNAPNMGMAPGMTQMGGQMAPPVGQPPQQPMGAGMPSMGGAPPQWQQAAQLPQTSGPQQAFEGELQQQGAGGDQSSDDPLDDFVNFHAQQATATGRANPNIGFFDTLKQARDRDPEGFYMLLGAVATGDPDRVAQTAGQLRQQRLHKEEATQQELMGVARERGQRREQQQYRAGDRADRQQFSTDAKRTAVINRQLDKWSNEGMLDKIEEELGAPVDETNFEQARRFYSQHKDDEKFNTQKVAYITRLTKGITPPDGRIKKAYDEDPDFRRIVDEANAYRKHRQEQVDQREKDRMEAAERERRAADKMSPAWKERLHDLQKQRDAFQKRMFAAQDAADENLAMSTWMPDGPYATTQENYYSEFDDMQAKYLEYKTRVDDMLHGARGSSVTDEDVDYDAPPPPPAAPKKRDFSKLDQLLSGGP